MNHQKIAITAGALLMTTLLYSCKESDTNALQEAQLCLNTASSSQAMACVSKIETDPSRIAYSLRCSAIFISQGFGNAVDFVNALNSINGSANCTSCSSTVNALNALKFTAAGVSTPTEFAANNAAAANAFSQCSQADAKIYTQIASIFRLGTLTAMLAYQNIGASYTQDQLAAQIANLTPTDVGAIVNITYVNTCQNLANASDSTIKYCAELKIAVDNGATETEIGQCLIEKLQNPNYAGPLCDP